MCSTSKYWDYTTHACESCYSGCSSCSGPTFAECNNCLAGEFKVSFGSFECVENCEQTYSDSYTDLSDNTCKSIYIYIYIIYGFCRM